MTMPRFKAPMGFMPEDDVNDKETFRFLGEAYKDGDEICLVSMDNAKFDDKAEHMKDMADKKPMEEGDKEASFDDKFDKLYDESGGKF